MNKRNVSASEYNSVTEIANKYIEALRTGNVELLSEVFYKNSVTYGSVNGELMGGIDNPTIDFINKYGGSSEIIFHIDILAMTPTTSFVQIITENDAIGSDCNDYLSLVKLDVGWKIIAKTFHQFDK